MIRRRRPRSLAAVFAALVLTIGVSGVVEAQGAGRALDFDGINDYVLRGSSSGLSGSGPRTIEAWVKYRSAPAGGNSGGTVGIGATALGQQLYLRGFSATSWSFPTCSGAPRRITVSGDSAGNDRWHCGGTETQLAVWQHVAATIDGSNVLRIYRNGVLTAANALAGSLPLGAQLWSGVDGHLDNFTDGQIDEVRMWSAALSQATLQEWMNRLVTASHPNYIDLKAYWKYDESSGTNAADASGNGHDGTMTNMDGATDHVTSTAPVGDASQVVYGDTAAILENASVPIDVSFTDGPGSEAVLAAIQVNSAPTSAPSGSASKYWEVWLGLGSGSYSGTVTLHYDGLVTGSESTLSLYRRSDATGTWAPVAASQNREGDDDDGVGSFSLTFSQAGGLGQFLVAPTPWLYHGIFAGGRFEIRRIRHDGTGSGTLHAQATAGTGGIAFDTVGEKMYFADFETRIQRASYDGSSPEDVVTTGLSTPQGIAIDSVSRKLYVVNRGLGKIQRMNLDGTGVEDLATGQGTPLQLDLDEVQGKVYWTVYQSPVLHVANLDGSGATTVNVGAGMGLHAVAIDDAAGKVYYSEYGVPGNVKRANLDGSGVELLASGRNNVIDIAVYPTGGLLFWSEYGGQVWRASLTGGSPTNIVSVAGNALAVEVLPNPPSVSITAGGPTAVCTGGSVLLNAHPSGGSGSFSSYQWYRNGVALPGETSNATTATVAGSYTVTVTDSALTTSPFSPPVVVAVNSLPSVSIASTGSICNAAVILTAFPSGGSGSYPSYQWYLGGVPIVGAIGGTHVATSPGSYTVTVTDSNTCTSAQSPAKSVACLPPVAVMGVARNPGCTGERIRFDGFSSYHTDPQHRIVGYQWDFGDGFTAAGAVVDHPYGSAGTYRVMLTVVDDNEPPVTDVEIVEIVINLTPTASASINGPATVCSGQPTTLLGTGGTSCLWAPASGLSDPTSCNPTASPTTTTAYSLTVIDANGCASRDPEVVTVSVYGHVSTVGATLVCPNGLGGTATVTSPPPGGPNLYQWGYRTVSGGTVTDIAGKTGSAYDIQGADFPGLGFYYLVCRIVSATCGTFVSNETGIWVSAGRDCGPGIPESVQFFNVTTRNSGGVNILQLVSPASSTPQVRVSSRTDGTFPGDPADGTVVQDFTATPNTRVSYSDTSVAAGTTYSYAAFSCAPGCLSSFSGAMEVAARPFSSPAKVKWLYSTAGIATTPPGVKTGTGAAALAVSNDRNLHAMSAGAAGGVWPATWLPYAMNAPAQSRPIPVALGTTTIGGTKTVVFVGAQDGRVYAFNSTTGALLWSSPVLGDSIQASPSAMFTDFGGLANLVFAGTRNTSSGNVLFALNALTGAVVWSFDNGGGANGIGIITGQPAVDYGNQRVYFTSRTRAGGSSDTVWCLKLTTPTAFTKLWSRAVGSVDASIVSSSGTLYVGTTSGDVRALLASTGADKWLTPFSTGDGAVKSLVWPVPPRLYFSTTTKVWAITDNGTSTTPTAFWTNPVGTIPNPANPIVISGRAYVGGGDGKIYEINAGVASPPAPLSVTLGDPATPFQVGQPTNDAANGLLYVGTESGQIYAVARPF